MIQTKRTAGRPAHEPRQRVVGVARADLRLDVGDRHPRTAGQPARGLDPLVERGELGQGFERIAGRHQPPDPVEAEPGQRQPRHQRDAPRAAD